MRSAMGLVVLLSLLLVSGCGLALQRASVSRSFQGRFGCAGATTTRVSDGYRVTGCGRSAEYVCFSDPDDTPTSSSHPGLADVIASALVGAALTGFGERCVLAASERDPHTPVLASDAPVGVARRRYAEGRVVLKTRVLFAGGSLRALAAPNDHPEHVLLIVHSVVRMQATPCASEIFHDGVAVPILQDAREGHYEARLALPIAALDQVEKSVRFAGSICGTEFELDPSGRATLGLFVARVREERARLARASGAERAAATESSLEQASSEQVGSGQPLPVTASAAPRP